MTRRGGERLAFGLIFIAVSVAWVAQTTRALAFSKKQTPSNSAKMVVTMAPISQVTIALPQAVLPSPTSSSAPTYDFGPNLDASLCAKLVDDTFHSGSARAAALRLKSLALEGAQSSEPRDPPTGCGSPCWDGTNVIPAAKFTFLGRCARDADRGPWRPDVLRI